MSIRLEFSAAEVYDREWDHNGVPVSFPYTVAFWLREGRMAVRWAPPASGNTDGMVMAGSGTAQGQVRDVVAVAFYPVALGARGRERQVYVMSVWRRRDNGTRDSETLLVAHLFLYEETRRARSHEHAGPRVDPPDQLAMPVDAGNAAVPWCLRFSQAEVDRSVHDDAWARFGWRAAQHADGYVVAAGVGSPWLHEPRDCARGRGVADTTSTRTVSIKRCNCLHRSATSSPKLTSWRRSFSSVRASCWLMASDTKSTQ